MGYFVSRQHYAISGERVVEVEMGGLDYAGPDMLVDQYPGEGKEYDNPVDAINAAIAIRDAWNVDLEKSGRIGDDEGDAAVVVFGTTGGILSGISPEGLSDEDLVAKAWGIWEKLPKCDRCGDALPKNYWHSTEVPDLGKFCREYCLEEAMNFDANDEEMEEEEDEDDES